MHLYSNQIRMVGFDRQEGKGREGRGALISYLMGARRRRIEGADEERGNGPTKTWRLTKRPTKILQPGVGRRRWRRRPVAA